MTEENVSYVKYEIKYIILGKPQCIAALKEWWLTSFNSTDRKSKDSSMVIINVTESDRTFNLSIVPVSLFLSPQSVSKRPIYNLNGREALQYWAVSNAAVTSAELFSAIFSFRAGLLRRHVKILTGKHTRPLHTVWDNSTMAAWQTRGKQISHMCH